MLGDMALNTLLIDLDGTLVDAFTTILRSYQHTLPKFGYPAPSMARVRRAVGGGLTNAMAHFLPPELIPAAIEVHLAYSEQILLEDVKLLDKPVSDAMDSPFPVVDAGQSFDSVVKLLSKSNPAVLVRQDGSVLGIVTRGDMLYHLMAR